MTFIKSSEGRYLPNLLEAYCVPCLWLLRILGLVQLDRHGKAGKRYLRLIDYTLFAWSTVILFGTFMYCIFWFTGRESQPIPRTPMELIIVSVDVLFEICGPLSYVGLIVSFWSIRLWLTECGAACQPFLTAKDKLKLRVLTGIVILMFTVYLYVPINGIVKELKKPVTDAEFSPLLRVFSKHSIRHTIALLTYASLLVFEVLSILGQCVLIFMTATIAYTFETMCQMYGSATLVECDQILDGYFLLCARLRTLSNRMKLRLFFLCLRDFVWALSLVTKFHENSFPGSSFTVFLGLTLVVSAVRTVALVNVEIQADAMGDAVSLRILTMEDGKHKKNAILRLNLMDRAYNGFTAGELIYINRDYIVGFIGLLVTYTIIAWDEKSPETKLEAELLKNATIRNYTDVEI